jgi:monofunctional biosynthetic peptidoglycan transglycosylase
MMKIFPERIASLAVVVAALGMALAVVLSWSAAPLFAQDPSELESTVTLVDFRTDTEREWFVVNDGVMGGRSSSTIGRTADGTGMFAGAVSLENNGGFASVRTRLEGVDVASPAGGVLRVKGDGQQYQLRFRTDNRFDGVAYRASFETSGEGWEEVTLPFSEFVPSFRGRVVEGADPLDPAAIRQLTIMIADKQEGDFRLEVAWVKAFADDL